MKEKLCAACRQIKPIIEFGLSVNPETRVNFVNTKKYKTNCKICDAEYARQWRKKHKGYKGSGELKKLSKEDRLLISAVSRRLYEARKRAEKIKAPFNLTKQYLFDLFKKQKGICVYSGMPISLKADTNLTISLDKIIPDLGYVIDNVQWVCWCVNRAKGDLSEKDFLDMCKKITEKCNDYPVREYIPSGMEAQNPLKKGDDIV